MGKRELVALLNLSSWCLVMGEWLFLAVPWGCLQFVIVVFPDHSHLLFFINVIMIVQALETKAIFLLQSKNTLDSIFNKCYVISYLHIVQLRIETMFHC